MRKQTLNAVLNINIASFNDFSKQAKRLENRVVTHKREVVMPYYFQKMQTITSNATWIGREQIKDAVTRTGQARAAAGEGHPGRIVTEKFINGFKHTPGKKVGDNYEFEIGWLNQLPYYAAYQELGFKHRSGVYVTGADALGAAQRYIRLEMEKLR